VIVIDLIDLVQPNRTVSLGPFPKATLEPTRIVVDRIVVALLQADGQWRDRGGRRFDDVAIRRRAPDESPLTLRLVDPGVNRLMPACSLLRVSDDGARVDGSSEPFASIERDDRAWLLEPDAEAYSSLEVA
jgi:hypothetical protein